MAEQVHDNFIVAIIKAVGTLPNTFWGINILAASMYIAVKYNSNIGYYFAGIGSTLTGIQHLQQQQQPNVTYTATSNPPAIKVESNASETTS